MPMNSGTVLSTPSQGPDAHADFIKTQLPTWLVEAAADIRAALRDSLLKSNQSRHQLRAILARIQSPEAFALPLLEKALKSEYLTLLNAKTSILVREWKASHLLGLLHTHARTTEQSLLEAALQNFEASEAQDDGMDAGSGIFNTSPSGRIDTLQSPTLFAGFCRRLDLGEKYARLSNPARWFVDTFASMNNTGSPWPLTWPTSRATWHKPFTRTWPA
jgi:hypothetical protein